MAKEFYRKHRPTKLKRIIGQDAAVAQLQGMAKKKRIPHAQLYSGPSGVGKTTAARVMLTLLGCEDGDCMEVNAATERGIQTVREIERRKSISPFGRARLWIIDEADQLTKDSQRGLLKVLEDTPDHAYFILATTDPQRLLPTIRTRCTEIKFHPIPNCDMEQLLTSVSKKEGFNLKEKVRDKIVAVANGSARKALVILHQISDIPNVGKQLAAVQEGDCELESNELAKALIKAKPKWGEVRKILREIKGDAETIRRIMLGYARTQLINGWGNPDRAMALIDLFENNFYDGGEAALALRSKLVCDQAARGGKR